MRKNEKIIGLWKKVGKKFIVAGPQAGIFYRREKTEQN